MVYLVLKACPNPTLLSLKKKKKRTKQTHDNTSTIVLKKPVAGKQDAF